MSSEKVNSIDWEKIDIDKIRFVLDQSEKCLNGALSNTESLDRKAFFILFVSVASSFACLMLALTQGVYFQALVILASLFSGFLLSSIYSLLALRTNTIELIGNKPMEMLKSKHSGYDLMYLIACEAQSNEGKITKATEVNAIKGKKINISINIIQFTLIVALLAVVAVNIPLIA